MAKCEKCGKEYLDGTEHVCSPPEAKKPETNASSEKTIPAGESQPQMAENPAQ